MILDYVFVWTLKPGDRAVFDEKVFTIESIYKYSRVTVINLVGDSGRRSYGMNQMDTVAVLQDA